MSDLSSSVSLALSSANFTGAGLTGESFTGQSSTLWQAIIESMMQGVLIVNEQGKVVQSNSRARKLCRQLRQDQDSSSRQTRETSQTGLITASAASIPQPVWNVCRSLLSSRQEFPEYNVIPEEEIEVSQTTHLKIYAQWLDVDDSEGSYMLVTLEDRSEMLRNLARWDAHRYCLTEREAEVWMLKCQRYSYDEIADELFISRNTVKKHLKSITFKRESSLNDLND